MSEAHPENALFSTDEAQELRGRWDAVQTEFVDEPRKSVIQRLSQIFTDERDKLETPGKGRQRIDAGFAPGPAAVPLVLHAAAFGLRGNAI
jgi:hypothetical protein